MCTRSLISFCWSRKRRAALAIDTKSSPTLKITTPRTLSGMPWWVTHSTDSCVSLRSSESLRTACTPGSTSVPRPVTMRNPMPSPRPSFLWLEPEMISASLGSATRHIILKTAIRTATAPTATAAMIPMPMDKVPFTGAERTR